MALRSPLTVQPYDYISDSTGRPLDKGQIYIGVANQDPEFYQIPVYLDAAMTKPIDQPIRTNDGFVDFAGSLSELYASAEIYSVKVLDKEGRKVLYKGDMTRKNLMSDALADLNQSIIDMQTAAQITLNAAVNSANTEVAQTVSSATAAIDTATTKSNKAATDADAAIKTLFENGGLPATPFKTKALMTASSLANDKYAMVTDDTVNNGLYIKTAGAWVKSKYDKADINSPKLLGTPTAPTAKLTIKDDTIATTKFVNDLANYRGSKLASINLANYSEDEYLLTDDMVSRGILSVYGIPTKPVTLVAPSGTERHILVFNSVPSQSVYIKIADKSEVFKLSYGRFFVALTNIGAYGLYEFKLDSNSPVIYGNGSVQLTPPLSARDNELVNARYVKGVTQSVSIENVTDSTTEISTFYTDTLLLKGSLTKNITLTIPYNEFTGTIVNRTTGGKSVFLKGIGQNDSVTFIELKSGEGKKIYSHVTVVYEAEPIAVSSGTLPKASQNTLGGIKVGGGLSIDSQGVLSASSQNGSGSNLSYSGKFKVGSDYNVGDVVEHGSGIYQVNTSVTNAKSPLEDSRYTKIMHNHKAGDNGSVTVLSNEYETYSSAYNIPYKLSKSGTLLFNRNTSPLRYSKDLGRTWDSPPPFTPPESAIVSWVYETDDDELLIAVKQFVIGSADKITVHKSQGWDGINGNAPQWTQVFEMQRQGASIVEWGVSSYKNYVVMAEYGAQKGKNPDPEDYAKYAYLSKDHGKTWETIFNLDDHVTTQSVHMHGACFDPYWNRIWISHGDGAYNASLGIGTNGLYYSDDLGKTWVSALETSGEGANFPQSVGIVALPTCILFSSDSTPNGVQRIDRAQGRTPVKGFYEVESAYLVPDSSPTGLSHILTVAHKAEWLPNAPYVWGFAAESRSGKIGCVLSWDGWKFHEVWVSDNEFTKSTGVKAVMGITPENTIILSGDGEGVGGNDSVKWSRTLKVSIEA